MNKRIICVGCGTKVEPIMKRTTRYYQGDGYDFKMDVDIPHCPKCDAPIYDEDIEKQIREIANQKIREQKNIITREEILYILEKYNVSQKFLSKLLGWGEITLTRYISGNNTPNQENSKRLKSLSNPYVFQKLLNDYSEKISDIDQKLYIKSQKKLDEEFIKLQKEKGKIYKVIDWFLYQSSEENPITHLALQKILYFVQGWGQALTGQYLYHDKCQAWVHGAVYPEIYNIFKEFGYSPLPRIDFEPEFLEEEYKILNAIKSFYLNIYSAKTLEYICHSEEPFIKARGNIEENTICHEEISDIDVKKYYRKICEQYDISLNSISNIKNYISDIVNQCE